MTKQEIFDKVLARAAIPVKSTHRHPAQGSGEAEVCAYRADDYPTVPPCFVGIFIPDSLHHHQLENKGVRHIDVRRVLFYAGVLKQSELNSDENNPKLELLYACQRVHDTRDPVDWPEALRMVAANHDVEFHWPATDEVQS